MTRLFQTLPFAFSYNVELAKQTPHGLKRYFAVYSKAYLELRRTSTMELFCEISKRDLAVNYFRKKAPSQILVLHTLILHDITRL